jgi:hypothetical protein
MCAVVTPVTLARIRERSWIVLYVYLNFFFREGPWENRVRTVRMLTDILQIGCNTRD